MQEADLQNIEILETIPGIKILITPYFGDTRIAKISFINEGNTNVPSELLQAIIIPEQVSIPHLLKMTPNVWVYPINNDEEIESIGITIGSHNLMDDTQDILLALIVLKGQEANRTLFHCCCELNLP